MRGQSVVWEWVKIPVKSAVTAKDEPAELYVIAAGSVKPPSANEVEQSRAFAVKVMVLSKKISD